MVCLKDCTGLTFNSFAKGVIADRAMDALFAWTGIHGERVVGAVVNLGGDIALRSFPIRVVIEDPARRSKTNRRSASSVWLTAAWLPAVRRGVPS